MQIEEAGCAVLFGQDCAVRLFLCPGARVFASDENPVKKSGNGVSVFPSSPVI